MFHHSSIEQLARYVAEAMLAVFQPQHNNFNCSTPLITLEVELIKYFDAISIRVPAVDYALFVYYLLA
jgi:hypothetical protein